MEVTERAVTYPLQWITYNALPLNQKVNYLTWNFVVHLATTPPKRVVHKYTLNLVTIRTSMVDPILGWDNSSLTVMNIVPYTLFLSVLSATKLVCLNHTSPMTNKGMETLREGEVPHHSQLSHFAKLWIRQGIPITRCTYLGSTGIGKDMMPSPSPIPTKRPTSPDHAPAATTNMEKLMLCFSPFWSVTCIKRRKTEKCTFRKQHRMLIDIWKLLCKEESLVRAIESSKQFKIMNRIQRKKRVKKNLEWRCKKRVTYQQKKSKGRSRK